MKKEYFIKASMIVSLERYRDRLRYIYEIEIENLSQEEFNNVCDKLNDIDYIYENLHCKGRNYCATWDIIEKIKAIDNYINIVSPL